MIVTGKFEVVDSLIADGGVELFGAGQVRNNVSGVVGAGCYDSLEVIGGGIGIGDGVESALGFAVVFSHYLGYCGIVALDISESADSGIDVACSR